MAARARGRAWRALLSALAGSGLTVAGLAGPLAGGAIAADAPVGTTSPAEGATATTPASTPAEGATGTTGAPTNTSSTTTPAPSTAQPTTTPAPPPVVEAPAVVVQRRQKTTPSKTESHSPRTTSTQAQPTTGGSSAGESDAKGPKTAAGPNGVAPSPQLVAAQAGALAAELASSAASVQALGFYRIPLFLLPIYRAAAIQYGVPWQILAAINEVETDYGSDLSVSSAGAEGWMQFEPSTWLQYGVDALDAGYADPYNPVDAIFAAARYLHAAGASKNLHTAILAYNHSEAYAESVLLRAKLISGYPKSVIATLTGLVDARLPVTGKQVAWGPLLPTPPSPSTSASPSSATANAKAVAGVAKTASGTATTDSAEQAGTSATTPAASTPGSTPAPAPAVAAATANGTAGMAKATAQFVELLSTPNASVVAVQDGRVLGLGHSHRLGKYVILRDIYGDVFTYAGLGSIAPHYRLPKVPSAALVAAAKPPVSGATGSGANAAGTAAGAGDTPLTLHVKQRHAQSVSSQDSTPAGSAESVPAATGKVRLFAHPGNPDALAAAARVTTSTPAKGSRKGLSLRRGSLVAEGTVLGHVLVPKGAKDGHLRFAVQPAGDSGSIDPRPVLANWKELDEALHPRGAKAKTPLLGATASDVFLLSKSQLELAVLSDPGIELDARARHEISSGAIDRRVLAVLAFLSRSGLKPTVQALRRGPRLSAAARRRSGADADTGGAVEISAVNGIPIAGHEGAGSITDSTIRTLLTLQGEFVPSRIVSLMRYPAAANTLATTAHPNAIQIDFKSSSAVLAQSPRSKAARAAVAKAAASSPLGAGGSLTLAQWNELLARVGAIHAPKLAAKPTSAAIRDPQAAPSNRGLGLSSSGSSGSGE
ncbi:MAG TPA: lytic murein transglycosylase [Solirubrobacteraceae bacterium]